MATIATELIESKRDERGRKITPRAEREALVEAYRASGMTQRAFAQREGIKYATFTSWVQECRRPPTPPKVGFAELSLQSAVPGMSAILEVQMSDGMVLRGGNADELARLVQLLRC